MSEKTKSFGAGAIMMGLLVTFVSSVAAYIGVQASHVPVIEKEFDLRVNALSKSIERLTDATSGLQSLLDKYVTSQRTVVMKLDKELNKHAVRLIKIEDDCRAIRHTLSAHAKD